MTDYDIDIDSSRERVGGDLGGGLAAPLRRKARRVPAGRARAPAPASPPGRGGGEQALAADALEQYVRSLGAPPVLSRAQTYELARAIEAERQAFLDELYAIPGTAVKLVERWAERRRRGHVTALLSARYRDPNASDAGPEIDRALGRLARLVERREQLASSVRESASAERAALEGRIARAAKRAGVDPEIVHQIHRELCALRGAPRTRAAREQRRRLGLDDAAHRARLERAGDALERMDRVKQTFVLHNLRLVIKQSRRFRNMGVPFVDLIQEGNLGLIRAVEKFDYRRGHKFSTYAVWWIDQALVRVVQNASRTVRVPTHVYDLQVRLRRVREQLRTKLARAPTPEELAEAVGVTAGEVEWAGKAMQSIISTEATLPGTEEFKLEDVLADEDACDPVDEIGRSELRRRLGEKLASLDVRDRKILEARFGLTGEEPATLQVIGDRMGLSRERIRQLATRALARLRERAEADGLTACLDQRLGAVCGEPRLD